MPPGTVAHALMLPCRKEGSGARVTVSKQMGGTSWELILCTRDRQRTHDRSSRGFLAQTALPNQLIRD